MLLFYIVFLYYNVFYYDSSCLIARHITISHLTIITSDINSISSHTLCQLHTTPPQLATFHGDPDETPKRRLVIYETADRSYCEVNRS